MAAIDKMKNSVPYQFFRHFPTTPRLLSMDAEDNDFGLSLFIFIQNLGEICGQKFNKSHFADSFGILRNGESMILTQGRSQT